MPPGPLLLTNVKPAQLNPNYWVDRLPEPDRVLITPEQLEILNEDTRAIVKDQVDVFKLSLTRQGAPIRELIEREYTMIKGRLLFGVDDQYLPKSLFETQIRPLVQWEKVPPQIKMRWGAAARSTSVRALPSEVKMLEEKGDIEFDQLQFTLIKLWTPVGIYHESSDGNWFYIQAPYTRGWVRSKDIAVFPTRGQLKKYSRQKQFLVVTGESAPLYADAAFQQRIQRPSMGTIVPLADKTADAYAVFLPAKNKTAPVTTAYFNRSSDVTPGFLSFTQRNVIHQAFKLLGARYGWGGMYHGRDCSAFTQDVFLTVGIDMPRGSKEQSFVGTQLGIFNYKGDTELKMAALGQVLPGITIFRMPHHLMLYLGEENGQHYVIHCTWAERYSMTSDAKNRINQVVISDLTLNGRSHLGSLFDRIISMNEINWS